MDRSIQTTADIINNSLAGNRATLTLGELPGFEYNSQDFTLPGLNLNAVPVATPFSTMKFPGDKINFDSLTVTFIIDEKLSNWIALFNWITGLGFPENYDQYKNRNMTASDGNIIIYSNMQNPLVKAKFVNMIPVNLGSIDFSSQDEETVMRRSTIQFDYDYFTINPI